MISTSNPFQSNLTKKIHDYIRMTKPTHESPIDSWQVAKAVLNSNDIDYKAVQPIRSYLNQLAAKKLLTSFGEDHALEVRPRIYFIKEPFQLSYWSK